MRNTYRILIRQYFCQTVFEYRKQNNLTQAEMAERLCMDERSYIELDHGKSGCSVVTLVLFLMRECPDVDAFLLRLERLFEQAVEEKRKEKEPALLR